MGYESNVKGLIRGLKKWEIDVLTAIGYHIEGVAKYLVPYDTGNLKGSIGFKVDEKNKRLILGTNVDYALKVEKGDEKQEAQPYLTPAVEGELNTIRKITKGVKIKHGVG